MNYLQLAYNVTKEDIDFLYDMCDYILWNMDNFKMSFDIGDIMSIEACYKYINNKAYTYKEEDADYTYYYYSVQTLENIPVFEPKNGNVPFCEF